MRWSPSVAAFLFSPFLSAQTTGVLIGRVLNGSAAPLPDATVQAVLPDTQYTTVSGSDGTFRFASLPTGLYLIRASHVGHATAEQAEVWVRSGKVEQVELNLYYTALELTAVQVVTYTIERSNTICSVPLTVEQSLRFPATFFDPARLAMSYAGVASTSDQANHFSIRGNGPMNNTWHLEGAEIVTPNHLTNAGTASDLPTLSGGGTTILSAQMLGTSHLLMGTMASPYGNAVGGIMDLRLRPGGTERQAFTVQAGLIGIDLCAEGPLRKGGRASYLINYRYSTLGLLGRTGVALGDEAITFQDLSFHLALPIGTSELTVFGMGGNSSNRFAAKDSAEWEFDKDSQNIDYTAMVGAAGVSFAKGLGKNGSWKTTAVISANDQERFAERTDDVSSAASWVFRDTASLLEQKLSVVSMANMYVGRRARMVVGGSAMQRTVSKANRFVNESLAGWLMRPFFHMERSVGQHLQVDLGLAYAHWTANASACVEPRVTMRWNANERNRISVGAGQRSQLPSVQNYALHYRWITQQPIAPTDNSAIGLLRSQDVELSYEHRFTRFFRTTLTGFFQRLLDVPVGGQFEMAITGGGYSLLNEWDALTVLPLTAQGEGFNAGGQFSLERTMHRDLFYQVNATAFNSTYSDRFGETFNSRWNTGVIANAVLGREFVKQKADRKRTWGVNGRVNYTGGQWYTPRAVQIGKVVAPYSAQLKAAYRIDLRIYLKRERQGRTGMWSLDLLNATNAQNEGYRYFDFRKGQEVTKYQLGLIPNISYRIEF